MYFIVQNGVLFQYRKILKGPIALPERSTLSLQLESYSFSSRIKLFSDQQGGIEPGSFPVSGAVFSPDADAHNNVTRGDFILKPG